MIFFKSAISKNVINFVLITYLATCFSLSQAQDSLSSEQVYLQDFPVVLSASRLSQPLSEAPNAMTVIDREMIRSSGFRTISDIFRLVPGMYVGALDGHTPVVGYHGSTEQYSRRMQVLIDGRSVYLPPFSSVDWEDIPLNIEDIERIEVVRGPAAASFGANSLQGVINIITRDAASVHHAELSMIKGSVGVADLAAHLGQAGETVDYRLTLAHREDSGYGSVVLNDGKRTNQANIRANYHPVGTDSFDFQLGGSDSTRGLGVVGREDEGIGNTKTTSAFQQLTWLRALDNGDEFKTSYYHINRNYIDENFLSGIQGGLVSAQTVADRHDLELQHTVQMGKNNRMVWGAGVRFDYSDNKEYFSVPYTVRQTRAFAHDEWKFTSDVLLNAGAMAEDDGLGHVNSSPRLALNWHFMPQHTVRVGTSVAYRTPAIFEEKVNIPNYYVAKGGLRPEKNVSREIGYLGEFNSAGITLDVRGYDDLVSDIIFYDPTGTDLATQLKPYSFTNLYSARYSGYESTLKYHWSDRGNVAINLSRQFVRCEITGVPTLGALVLPYLQAFINDCPLSVPDYSGSILLTQQLAQALQFSAAYYHQGRLKTLDSSFQSTETTMNRVDLRLAQSFGTRGAVGSGEVALVVQNAFEDDFTKFSLVPQTDNMLFQRRAYIYATYHF